MRLLLFSLFLIFLSSCDSSPVGNTIPVFTHEDEKELSALMLEEINMNPNVYGSVITNQDEKFVYGYVERVIDSISSANFPSRSGLSNKLRIIDDSFNVLIFSIPDDIIFISSGLLLYLNGEDELASLLARELYFINGDLVLSQILDFYGIPLTKQTFTDTNRTNIAPMIQLLRNNSYSLENESLGDLNTVNYLCDLSYSSDALAKVYDKILFDSTQVLSKNFTIYPLSEERRDAISAESFKLNCTGNQNYFNSYTVFKDSLKN